LKKADCGIAVSSATDAARAAASIVLTTPGLSVIIEAIKESRRIVQRMNSYAIYRIAETLRVLLFVSLTILIFNFFPVTAVMIVLLALLNDGAILSIAYDNVHYKDQPEAWNMRLVLGMASVLGIVGPVAAFGLFYLGDRVFHLGHPQLQTLMYLMLSVAATPDDLPGRTPRPVLVNPPCSNSLDGRGWHTDAGNPHRGIRNLHDPARVGLGSPRVGYALVWFLVTDRVKLLAYRILDPVKLVAVKVKPVLVAAAAVPGGGAGPDRRAAVATKVMTKVRVAAFHTDTDPEDPCITIGATVPMGRRSRTMATTSQAELAAAGVIGVSMPMRSGVSARMSALEMTGARSEMQTMWMRALLGVQPRWGRDFDDLSNEWRRLFAEVLGHFSWCSQPQGGRQCRPSVMALSPRRLCVRARPDGDGGHPFHWG